MCTYVLVCARLGNHPHLCLIRLGRQIAKAIFHPSAREILMCAVKRTSMKGRVVTVSRLSVEKKRQLEVQLATAGINGHSEEQSKYNK